MTAENTNETTNTQTPEDTPTKTPTQKPKTRPVLVNLAVELSDEFHALAKSRKTNATALARKLITAEIEASRADEQQTRNRADVMQAFAGAPNSTFII